MGILEIERQEEMRRSKEKEKGLVMMRGYNTLGSRPTFQR
jgi:hypothetical protein